PNGVCAARSGSTWMKLWSLVRSANRLTSDCVITRHSVGPSWRPTHCLSPSTVVVTASDATLLTRSPSLVCGCEVDPTHCRQRLAAIDYRVMRMAGHFQDFEYAGITNHVVFGAGASVGARFVDAVRALGVSRLIVVAAEAEAALADRIEVVLQEF